MLDRRLTADARRREADAALRRALRRIQGPVTDAERRAERQAREALYGARR